MLVAYNERFNAKLYKRVVNSNDYEKTPRMTFKCKVANQKEKSSFQVSGGVLTQNQGIYIISTRLPSDIQVDDRIFLLNKYWLVESVGYYISETNMLTNDLSDEKLTNNFIKGLKLV